MSAATPRPHYSQLTIEERGIIRRMKGRQSVAAIALILGKHRSTIAREIKRNTNEGGIYVESHAQARMRRRRKAAKAPSLIIENDLGMQDYIEDFLKQHLSPEQIVGWMRRSGFSRRVSQRTIYDWVHRDWQGRKKYLRFKGRPRVPYGGRKTMWQPQKRHISERPPVVAKRERAGDWEGDLVHGTMDDSRHALLTLNDRASGHGIVKKIQTLYPHTVAHIVEIALRGLPVHTITFDNGIEFGHHQTMEKLLKVPSHSVLELA